VEKTYGKLKDKNLLKANKGYNTKFVQCVKIIYLLKI